MYATARPNAVLSECAETMVSRGEIAFDSGSRVRVAATPAVMFSWVRCVASSRPCGDKWNDTLKTEVGSVGRVSPGDNKITRGHTWSGRLDRVYLRTFAFYMAPANNVDFPLEAASANITANLADDNDSVVFMLRRVIDKFQ